MEEAEELCDRVGIIDHGKLIALGTPKELIAKNQVNNLEEVFLKMTGRTHSGGSINEAAKNSCSNQERTKENNP